MFIKRRMKLAFLTVSQATFRKKKCIMKKLKEVKTVKSVQERQRRRMESKEERHIYKLIKEAKKKLRKLKEENRKKELLIHMFRVHAETGDYPDLKDLTKKELKGLLDLINTNMKTITLQLEDLKKDEAIVV